MATSGPSRCKTAPSCMLGLPRENLDALDEDPTAVPLCRKIASMNLTVADHDDRNIVQELRCISAVPDDPNLFRFQVVDVISRIQENCIEYKAAYQYDIPINHICITILYPTLLKPLYDLTKRINGNLMAELVAEKEKPENTLRDLLLHNKIDPEIYEVTTADFNPLSLDTNLVDLQSRMNKFPRKYALAINILRGKTNFFAKLYFRHKAEPELEEEDFFTELRNTTVRYATTIDRGEGFDDDESEILETPSGTDDEVSGCYPSAGPGPKNEFRRAALPPNHPDGGYDGDEEEVDAEWDLVPPEAAGPEAAPTGPAYASEEESDFLAGGDNKYSALFQHVYNELDYVPDEDDEFEDDDE